MLYANTAEQLKPSAPTKEFRRIRGLQWAELRDFGPFPKARGGKKKACVKRGTAYEKAVQRKLQRLDLEGELVFSQWIMFADENGLGWAQPDAYLIQEERVLLMEAKLTQTRDAEIKLLGLYLPLIRHIYQLPVVMLQVCKNLRVVPPKMVDGPQELIEHPGPGVFLWHYIGN